MFQEVIHTPAFSFADLTTKLYPQPHPTPSIESSISDPLTPYLSICVGNGLTFIEIWNTL